MCVLISSILGGWVCAFRLMQLIVKFNVEKTSKPSQQPVNSLLLNNNYNDWFQAEVFLCLLQDVPPDISVCVFVLEQALSVRALQEMVTSASQASTVCHCVCVGVCVFVCVCVCV